MRWVQSEYASKGLFLGLLLFTSLQLTNLKSADHAISDWNSPGWQAAGRIALCMLVGLGCGMVLGAVRQFGDFVRMIRRPHAFLLFLLLENPLLIYTGLLGGLIYGTHIEFNGLEDPEKLNARIMVTLALVGAVLGIAFGQLSGIKDFRYRLGLAIAVGAAVVYVLVLWLEEFQGGEFLRDPKRPMLGLLTLFGLPFYYLLCFVGVAEESETEASSFCTMLGFSIWLLRFPDKVPQAGFLLPTAIFLSYVIFVLPNLRVFKHTLRGFTYMEVGKTRRSLLAFRRAMELDPHNALAHQGMDALHSNIEVERIDDVTKTLLDPNRCLDHARRLLAKSPSADQMKKALHLLDLVEKLWPKLISHVIYHRAVAAIHMRDLDTASNLLNDLLTTDAWFPDDPARKTILFDAWQLVLLVHPALRERVGLPQLALPGRRIEAIGAVERQLAMQPDEPVLAELRKSLYADLQEDEYNAAAKESPPTDFSHRYAEELGMSLIGNQDQWQRGAQFLRIAAHGLPARRPSIYQRLAEAYAKAGETIQATRYLQEVRDCGLKIGVENLPADQRQIYFSSIKRLGDEAAARDEIDEAIYNYSLSTHDPTSGVPTLRALAEQYQKKTDVMNALRITEKALCHDGRDPDLLQKKDSYYYSLEPASLAAQAKEDDNVRKFFDVSYCVRKAKGVLDNRNTDLDTLDWADHLVKLALVMQPKNLIALVQQSRIHLRRGEREEGLRLLEDVRELKPSGTEETEAWFFVHKQLGKIYFEELNRPDLAIPCFLEYLNHVGSGAETLYDLGRAYEAVGDKANAIKHYRMVTAYEGHRLVWEAEAAIRRLKEES